MGPAWGQPVGHQRIPGHSDRTQGAGAWPDAPDLPDDIAFLTEAGITRDALCMAAIAAGEKGMAASEILIHRGFMMREDYEWRLAKHVGAEYRRHGPDPDLIATTATASTDELRTVGVMERSARQNRLFVSPQASGYARIAALAAKAPDTFANVVFTGRAELRHSLFLADRQGYARRAVEDLAQRLPDYSANRRLSGGQIVAFVLAGLLTFGGLVLGADIAFSTLAVLLTGFYFSIVVLRAVLIVLLDTAGPATLPPFRPAATEPEDFPVYSVLVALKNEAGQVGALVDALDQLDWPKTRKEVFLVCEEDDPETILAIRSLDLPQGFELVICPPCEPRTKPKALNFALPLCSGRFTVIYDAEDRPHRLQLREAWEKLEAGGDKLACVQAPLLVHNRNQNWLTRLFAIEYRTQFLGTLPILERLGAPLSLGGTSNHFRGIMEQTHHI